MSSQSHAKGYDLDHLVEISNPQLDWEMLDIATGGGHTALRFAPLVKRVATMDLTDNMLHTAFQFVRTQGADNTEFHLADAENLPFQAGSFNLVTWLERQSLGPEMITMMTETMDEFPDSTQAWLQPQDWGTETASFVNHHILLAARK